MLNSTIAYKDQYHTYKRLSKTVLTLKKNQLNRKLTKM